MEEIFRIWDYEENFYLILGYEEACAPAETSDTKRQISPEPPLSGCIGLVCLVWGSQNNVKMLKEEWPGEAEAGEGWAGATRPSVFQLWKGSSDVSDIIFERRRRTAAISPAIGHSCRCSENERKRLKTLVGCRLHFRWQVSEFLKCKDLYPVSVTGFRYIRVSYVDRGRISFFRRDSMDMGLILSLG